MNQHEPEIERARNVLKAEGRDVDDFSFDISYLPPDPDGGGMFTVRYEVTITNRKTRRTLGSIGGIGLDWVGHFEDELKAGYFE